MRPRLFKKENYVNFNKDTNKSTCLLCKKELCGLIIGNIKRHYEKMHNIKFTRDYHAKATVNINTITRKTDDKVLKLSKNEFLKCCVGLIAVKNLPLRIFDDDLYFKQIIQPYQEKYTLNLNSENILDGLEFWSLRVRTHLKAKFCQKLICLKVDVVGRQGKNIMGIHVQCVESYQVVVHTIGAVQLKVRHTAHMLKEAILKCLRDFEIDASQLYAITCDSRGRALKALQLMQDEMEDIRNANAMELDDYSATENQFKPILSVVYSGAYIVELAARVYFKAVESDLNECRGMVKEIRHEQMENIFLPTLDSGSRWKSVFDMVSSLKEFTANTEIDYEFQGKMDWMGSFVETYRPLADWSQQQQCEQYIVGDFYRDWLVCEAKLKQMSDNEYAMHLLEAILEVKQKLLDNEAFNAALYFDPRFNHMDSPYFSEERRKQAVDHIMRIQALMNALEGDNRLISDDYEIQNDAKIVGRVEDPYNILEAEIPLISRNSSSAETQLSIRQKLENFAYNQRLPYSSDILAYWKHLQVKDPEIHVLLKVILAVSISQSSVERTLSALSTILAKEKCQISKHTLDNMLLVKLNPDILENVEA